MPAIRGESTTAIENSDVTFDLVPTFSCGNPAYSTEVTQAPNHGILELAQSAALYRASFFNGTDTFSIRVCVDATGECSNPATFSIQLVSGEFTGRPNSLEPYKNDITEQEVRYLLNKVAFGGCPDLVSFGVDQGLERLIDRMLTDENGGCEYSLPILPGGYVGEHSAPDNRSADAFAYWMAHPRHWNLPIQYWRSDLFYRGVVANLRYGNPLREYMWSMVWDPQFATNVLLSQNGSLHDAKLHYNALSSNALGYFEDFFRDFYGPLSLAQTPAEQRVPGIDPGLDFNPDRAAPTGTEIYPLNGPYSPQGLSHFQRYLNNETNAEPHADYPVQQLNENLGRESLELHTLGAFDIVSGALNYTESDVLSSTRGLTGYGMDFDGNFNADNNVNTRLTASGDDDAGPVRRWISFFNHRSSGARGIGSMLFADTPFARFSNWQANDWSATGEASNIFVYLLRHHPATARRLGARLFATLVNPNFLDDVQAAEAIVQELSTELRATESIYDPVRKIQRNTSFNIRRALRIILRSQAMFSRQRGGYPSPLEHLISTFRIADIQLRNQGVPDQIIQELSSAGQVPMAAPSVFAWPSRGTPSTGFFHDGSAWLDTTPLLAVHRAELRILNQTFLPAAGPPRMGDIIFPEGTATCSYLTTPNDGSRCPTARAVVDHVLRLFNLNGVDQFGSPLIDEAERQVLTEYLDRPSSPWPRNDLWRAYIQQGDGLVVERGIGLIYLVATHPLRFK